jgi:hypothetical protein
MGVDISGHALTVINEREIEVEWIRRTVESPELTETHPDGTEHHFRRIPERGDRVLRVVVNP